MWGGAAKMMWEFKDLWKWKFNGKGYLTDIDGVVQIGKMLFMNGWKAKALIPKTKAYEMEDVFEMRKDRVKALIKEFNNSLDVV